MQIRTASIRRQQQEKQSPGRPSHSKLSTFETAEEKGSQEDHENPRECLTSLILEPAKRSLMIACLAENAKIDLLAMK